MQGLKSLSNFDFFQKIGGGLVLRTVQNTGNGREGGVTNVEYRKLQLNLELFLSSCVGTVQ